MSHSHTSIADPSLSKHTLDLVQLLYNSGRQTFAENLFFQKYHSRRYVCFWQVCGKLQNKERALSRQTVQYLSKAQTFSCTEHIYTQTEPKVFWVRLVIQAQGCYGYHPVKLGATYHSQVPPGRHQPSIKARGFACSCHMNHTGICTTSFTPCVLLSGSRRAR